MVFFSENGIFFGKYYFFKIEVPYFIYKLYFWSKYFFLKMPGMVMVPVQ